ncbi:hypothetical protein DFP73DRAFT_531599 [Morchella snyderi]|nr:hypothetical protein DFP73DRAFT_531599 [Morchella snyderi]
MEPSDPFIARGFGFGGSPFRGPPFAPPQPTTHPTQPNPPPTQPGPPPAQPHPPPTLSATKLQAMRLAFVSPTPTCHIPQLQLTPGPSETVLAQLKDNTNHMLCLTSPTRDSTLSAEARGTALLQLKISAEVLLRVAEVASGYVGGAELRSAKASVLEAAAAS